MSNPRNSTMHRRLIHTAKAFRRNERGASAIEFAMVATFMSIVLLNIVDIAIFTFHKMEITGAVRAGAQYALVDTETVTDALVRGVVEDSSSLDSLVVTIDSNLCGCSDGASFACDSGTSCGSGTSGRVHGYTKIDASYTHTWIFYPGTTSITAQSTIRTQ